ncbi:MAG: exopolysaccharide biosynthesis protein [Alphaproteobacteria bacterium]|nr:exopolysaccharide biosynthesis protein [Alphaproteobacteria bacterium]
MKQTASKTSDIIAEIVADFDRDGTMTIDELLKKMGHRGLALAILVLAISSVVAGIIPGFSTLMAVPIMFICVQIMIGKYGIWLPESIRTKSVSPRVIHGSLMRSVAPMKKLEVYLKPRLIFLTGGLCKRLLALTMLLLAGVLAMPIPGGNFLPSMAITIIALAILERDGLLVIAAVAMIALTAGLMIEIIHQAWLLVHSFAQWLF